jgi:hypothetical protein
MVSMPSERPILNDPVAAAALAADALEAVVGTQRQEPNPTGERFTALAAALAGILRAGGELARVLAEQTERYGDDRVLRTDDGTDPYHRLGEAALALAALRSRLDEAHPSLEAYHAAISHLGIAVDPEAGQGKT